MNELLERGFGKFTEKVTRLVHYLVIDSKRRGNRSRHARGYQAF